jgi:predicted RNase H-like HicB family nuclease
MILAYVQEGLAHARYEQLEDGSYIAEVPELPGVLGTGATLEACRSDLAEVIEEWVLVRVARGLPVPMIGGRGVVVKSAS